MAKHLYLQCERQINNARGVIFKMTIKEYYETCIKSYRKNAYDVAFTSGRDKTINDFYENVIKRNLLPKDDVIAWHNMFMRYIELPGAVFWIRRYESCKTKYGGFKNRRACYTQFDDGFSYVFTSNFEAHEIFNMIHKGVVPDEKELRNLMRSFTCPLHYDSGIASKCEESKIAAYPNLGGPMYGSLTFNNWYLAHINAVNDKGYEYLTLDEYGEYVQTNYDDKRLFPHGEITDWEVDPVDNKMKRKLNYSLTDKEKQVVKAHFLRFVDPLNYFVVPSLSCEHHNILLTKKSIGEESSVVRFVEKKFEEIYGKNVMDEFRKAALVPDENIIDITYAPSKKKSGSKKVHQAPV
jgi:hypothetical protein